MVILKSQEAKSGRPYVEKPICAKCGKKHEGKYLVGRGNYYGCGKSFHRKRDYTMLKSYEMENTQQQASAPNPDARKKNCFSALQSGGDQASSLNFVTGLLQVFSINVYAFLDPGDTLYF